jgi:hypothetical protein
LAQSGHLRIDWRIKPAAQLRPLVHCVGVDKRDMARLYGGRGLI